MDLLDYLDEIRTAARKAIRGRRWVGLDDPAQEGALAVLLYHRSKPDEPMSGALAYTLAFNAARRYVEKLQTRARYFIGDLLDDMHPGAPAVDVAARLDCRRAFAAAALTEKQERAISHHGLRDMTQRDVQLVLGCTKSTAFRLLSAARTKLQGGLGPAYGEWSRKHPPRYTKQMVRQDARRHARHLAADPDAPCTLDGDAESTRRILLECLNRKDDDE